MERGSKRRVSALALTPLLPLLPVCPGWLDRSCSSIESRSVLLMSGDGMQAVRNEVVTLTSAQRASHVASGDS